MQNSDLDGPGPAVSKTFARKVRLSNIALFFERLWPRTWWLLSLFAAYAALSFAGVWPLIPALLHQLIIAAFAAAAVAAIVYAVRVPWPSREEAIRRIERRSGVAHRPASSYEDTLSVQSGNAGTRELWRAHRERLKRAIAALRVGNPSPRADRADPLALRVVPVLLLLPAILLASGSLWDRLASSLRFGESAGGNAVRVDAWVTPPPYTALPPVLLADGAGQASKHDEASAVKMMEVPEHSLLTFRALGLGGAPVSLEVMTDGAEKAETIAGSTPRSGDKNDVSEVRFELKRPARIKALAGSRHLGQWTFDVTPDQVPKITLDKDMTRTPRGSLKLSYKAEDDYGIVGAVARVRQAAQKPGDPAKSWARRPPLTGPRLPVERPPVLTLKVPQPGAKALAASTLLEMAEHPFAGQRVELWLEATDAGGNTGKSAAVEIIMPARRFTKPLARAVIEQRRYLSEDSRNRAHVARALDALTLEPEDFFEDTAIYLGLRSVYHRLERDGSRAALNESVVQLWQLALKIEDGKLSDAEKALKDVQDKLSDALKKGADDKEIQALIAELKAKINDYLKEMQKNAEKDQKNGEPGEDEQDTQELGQKDLDQMMQDLERNAKEGSREEAEKMLSDLRELMDRLQASTPESRAEQQRAKDMMKKLNKLDDLAGKQQQLMDDTFDQSRKQGSELEGGEQQDQSGDNSNTGKQGKQGKGQQKSQQNGSPQQGGETGELSQGEQNSGDPSSRSRDSENALKQRQADLRNQLNQLKKELNELGAGDPEKLGKAEEKMGEAENSLEQKDFESAAQEQAQALDQMRQAGKDMAQQMQKNAQQKLGRGGDTPRDPLGRPQRSEGPDLGTGVKVPDAFEAQRAREILDELRRRSGEALRPPSELDYIDRLLKRF